MVSNTHHGLDRRMTYPVDVVMTLISVEMVKSVDQPKHRKMRIELDGVKVGISKRVLTFYYHGLSCVTCGVKGTFFAVERWPHQHTDSWHINLYGHRADRTEVLMTKDHVIPASKGGKNLLSNLQPMCKKCNEIKGDK